LSNADNFVDGDFNGKADVFVKDLQTGALTLVSRVAGSMANGESSVPVISGDGRTVAFVSRASNLVAGDTNGTADVFVSAWQTGPLVRASVTSAGAQANGASLAVSISRDGRTLALDHAAANTLSTHLHD